MANVAHSGLTGADLHEPKGIATATTGKVYVADGAGSGAWTSLALSIPGDSFANTYIANDNQFSGTAGGTFTSGSFQTRTLNNEAHNGIAGASLAGNIITLPAGTYFVIASCPAVSVGLHKARLWNDTSGAILVDGTSERANGAFIGSRSWIIGSFVLPGIRGVRLQHRGSTTIATEGFGSATSFGDDEIYSTIQLWKLA